MSEVNEVTDMEAAMEILKEADAMNLKPETVKIKDALHTIYPNHSMEDIYEVAFKVALMMTV